MHFSNNLLNKSFISFPVNLIRLIRMCLNLLDPYRKLQDGARRRRDGAKQQPNVLTGLPPRHSGPQVMSQNDNNVCGYSCKTSLWSQFRPWSKRALSSISCFSSLFRSNVTHWRLSLWIKDQGWLQKRINVQMRSFSGTKKSLRLMDVKLT